MKRRYTYRGKTNFSDFTTLVKKTVGKYILNGELLRLNICSKNVAALIGVIIFVFRHVKTPFRLIVYVDSSI